jgi:hypothetical protein
MGVIWIPTDKHVYGAIYREHCNDLVVFGSCSAPEGDPRLGIMRPYMLTEWGFKDSDEPLIKSIGRKDTFEQREYVYEYFIAVVRHDDDLERPHNKSPEPT